MQADVILTAVLALSLAYVHVRQGPLVLQRNVRTARILLLVVLILQVIAWAVGAFSALGVIKQGLVTGPAHKVLTLKMVLGVLFQVVIWVLVIVGFWKLLAGCYDHALIRRVEKPDQTLRQKIRETLLEAAEKGVPTKEVDMFVASSFEDPLLESVRGRCESLLVYYPLSQKDAEKLREVAEELG